MNAQRADELVRAALMQAVPGPEVATVATDEPLRDALEMDSLDFLAFVENLSAAAGVRIDEDDYPQLSSINACVSFLSTSAMTT